MSDVGISDVAARAGVSVGTVSNFFNRPEVLATQTAERVRQAVNELGYVRNFAARDLRRGRARSIGLLVLDIGNPFFTEFVAGVEQVANVAGLAVILGNTKENVAKESSYLELFQEQRVAGVILSPTGDVADHLAALQRQQIPCVLLDDSPELTGVCSVSVDDRAGGKLAIEHLVDTGRRRILLLDGPSRIHQTRARRQGAIDAAARAGVHLTVREAQAFASSAAHETIDAILQSREVVFDAIFAANDIMALGAMKALQEHGLAVPRDVSVIGYDDISYASALSPALSSVSQPSELMGSKATELLLDEVGSPAEHRHQRATFTPELRSRQTT
ncbi:LacI family DNA-binding transcriptional regulator [Microbacterium aurum]